MNFNLLGCLCLSAALSISFVCPAQGLKLLNEEELAKYDEPEFEESAGYASVFPNSHDMRQYAPPVLIQNGGTCVGFAATYCAHSTMVNKALNRKRRSLPLSRVRR